jgi:hypothetical protein
LLDQRGDDEPERDQRHEPAETLHGHIVSDASDEPVGDGVGLCFRRAEG